MPARRNAIFSAVFPSVAQASQPTPQATPVLGSGQFEGSVSFSETEPKDAEDGAAERIKWERAWHTATAFLSVPGASISATEAAQDEAALRGKWLKPCLSQVESAIRYLVSEESRGRRLRAIKREDDLLDWYEQEASRHFIQYQLPLLLKMLLHDSESALSGVLRVLQVTQAIYMHPLKHHVLAHLPRTARYELSKFQNSYHAMVAMSLSKSSFAKQLREFLKQQASIVLGIRINQDDDFMADDEMSLIAEARDTASSVMESVDEVGMGGAQAQRIFAEVMSEILTLHVNTTYAGQWSSPSTIPAQLQSWVEDHFARFVVEILACLCGGSDSQLDRAMQVTATDVAAWKQRAICDLGSLRLKELFEVVVDWDNNSKGAIEDLKQYITTTAARAHLTNYFSTVISHRLLQPGASTTEILQVYICIIRAFAVLDPKGVLLDRLARPIRRYLRDRDDTVKIIVGGLLADGTDDTGSTDALVELALELNKITEISSEDDDGDLDWDDMSWLPDPVDAGPDFKKTKSADVIGTLISLFDTKDVFVKEFQNILGERLLKADWEFDKEIRVLELLKLRFGEAPLQACEVMLKDIHDSRRTDLFVKKEQQVTTSTSAPPHLYAKILSRLFWPSLRAETFVLPPSIAELQARYAAGFEAFKHARKLTWLPALGQVMVELHLEDRVVEAEVRTWQATVIHAFQDDATTRPVEKTVEQLVAELEMETHLVTAALTFWVGELVLTESKPGTFHVLERLPRPSLVSAPSTNTAATLAAASAASAAASVSAVGAALRSEADVADEKMDVFWQYIVGMLTNQGPLPLGRIVMMLKMVVPGGFPYGNEELREFLGGRVREGKVDLVGGSYRVVKGA